MMNDTDLEALGKDISDRGGLIHAIVLWREAGQTYLLDGRNRLEALERLGAKWQNEGRVVLPGGKTIQISISEKQLTNPASYVIAANIHRRHLSKEERAALIVQTVEVGQTKSDSAKMARSFSPVAGQAGGSTRDPVLAEAVAIGHDHGISKRTIERARAKQKGTATTPTKPPRRPPAAVVQA
jgi:hypothetical protein